MTSTQLPFEDAIVFGEQSNLAGVECRPNALDHRVSNTGVVLLTPGMLHHAGPFRLHVHLARRLAKLGYTTLRFDLSGIGDSLAVGASGSSLDRAAGEARAAMDVLASRHRIERFVLFGLCSGADDSVHVALQDERVVGLILLDGCGFPTEDFQRYRRWQHYLPRLTSIAKWKDAASQILQRNQSEPPTLQLGTDIREFPSRVVAEQQFLELSERCVRLEFIYTGGVSHYYNHETQFASMFPSLQQRDGINCKYFPQLDHVAFLCEDRADLINYVAERMEIGFPHHDLMGV